MNSLIKVLGKDIHALNKGLEEIKSIEVLEDGSVIVIYTITDEFMGKYELYCKKRKLELNPNNEYRKITDVGYIESEEF